MATENRNPSTKNNPGEKQGMNDRNQNEQRQAGNYGQNPGHDATKKSGEQDRENQRPGGGAQKR